MANICISFDNIDKVTPNEISKVTFKPRYEHVNVHMIFDIKMDGQFTIRQY